MKNAEISSLNKIQVLAVAEKAVPAYQKWNRSSVV